MNGIKTDQLKKWANGIFEYRSTDPFPQWMTHEALCIFYNENGHEAFVELVEYCTIVTCENGIKFIQSKITQ